MRYAAFSRSLAFVLFIFSSVLLVACGGGSDREGAEAEKPVLADEAGAAAAPAVDQTAPVPEGQALELLRFGPSGQVDRLSQVVAMFNQPMVGLGDYQNVPEGVLAVDPPVDGQSLWLNQYTLAFVPEKPLTGSLDLTVRLDVSKLRALSGAAADETREIEIKLPDLAVLNSYIKDDIYDEEQALRPAWELIFNQPPDRDDLAAKAAFVFQADDGSEKRVPAEVEIDADDLPESVRLRAKEKLPRNTAYRLVTAAGLKSTAGPKPAAELTLGESSTYGPLSIKAESWGEPPMRPDQGLYLNFSNPVDFRRVLPLISIDNGYDLGPLREYYARDPEAAEGGDEESVDHIGTYLYIDGAFKAESDYSLTIDGSAEDIFGQSLGEKYVYRFKTGQYPTNLQLGNSYGLLETATDPRFKLIASNIDEARIRAYALSAEEGIRFMAAANFNPEYFYGDFKESLKVLAGLEVRETVLRVPDGAKNGRTRVPVDLKKIYGDDLKGNLLYLESTWRDPQSGGDKTRRTFALVQVSDIGLAVKIGPSSGLIWVTDISAGRPWAEVDLELRGPEGELLWQGQSDADGLASLPGAAEMAGKIQSRDGRHPGIFVVARKDGQMSLWNAKWDDGLEPWRWDLNYGQPLTDGGGEKHLLVSALPLYKPGEKAEFKIISRLTRHDGLADYDEPALLVSVLDPLGQVAAKTSLEVGPFGTSSHTLAIPADATLGQWTVMAGRDESSQSYAGTFLVQTYRPPAFDIQFENFTREALSGQSASVDAKADYHFGAPVAGQPARYSVVSSPAWFSLPGPFSGYCVTNSYFPADEMEDSGYGYSEPSVTVASGDTKLDDDGRLKFPLSFKPSPDQKPAPRHYSIYLTVTDVDQRQVSANNKILVHPAELYVGLTSDNFVGETGRAFPIKFIVADREGRLAPDQPVTATIYRRQWQNVRRKSAGTAYEYVSRMVDEKIGVEELISRELPGEMNFTPEKPGYYIVQAEIKDKAGRTNLASYNFYVSGGGPVGWKMSNDDQLPLVPDKTSYQPGETARIMIQSPFDQGRGLLTVERNGIRLTKVFTIDSQTPIVEVPLAEADAPNVYVSVLLSRGRISESLDKDGVDFGKPAIRLGYVELKVPTDKNLLQVEVKPDQPEIGPGDEVEVEVLVADSDGRPTAEAEVALIVADAAVIQLAGDDGYFPQRTLHRDQPLMIQTADNLVSLIGRQNWGLKGGNPGGGGAMAAKAMADGGLGGLRKDFATLAFFEPHLNLDENGRGKIKIKMPENLSTFKIYAVATGHGLMSGTGQSSVLVTRDLLVRSALPGYAGVGDEFQAAMVVSNRSQKSGRATVTLAGENFELLDGAAEKTVDIAPGESREVAFKVKAGAAETAKFQFAVVMGQDRDGAEFIIPLSPANQLVTQASYERVGPEGLRTDLALPPGADLSRGGVEVELSPSLAGVLSEPFDWLLAYPHGCVEQSVSKAFASLTWLKLKDRFPADPEKEKKARANVENMLAKLARWENGGGYNYWPGMNDWSNRSVYLSAYALDFILTAKEAGFTPPQPELEKNIRNFLKQALDSDYKNWPSWFSQAAVKQSRAYALAMLSRAGENVAAFISVMYKDRAQAGLFELANLALAIHYQNQLDAKTKASQINTILKMLENHIHFTAGEIQFADNSPDTPEIWSTPVRNSALMLKLLGRVKPDQDLMPALVRWLTGESRAGHFGSTHNNALAVSALADYVQMMEPEQPDLNIRASLGETTLAEASFSAFTNPAVSGSAPLSALPVENPAVTYALEGRGQVWTALKIKSAPAAPDLSALTTGGFMLSRSFTILDKEGNGSPGRENFQRGDLVRVTVTMMLPARRHNIVLEDRVPAGFEPVNFQLRDADLSLMALNNNENSWSAHWYNHQEIWPDRVAVYADYLDSGVYTFSYLARAVTPGTYLTPGPTAEEMYAPETFGRGAGQSLSVR